MNIPTQLGVGASGVTRATLANSAPPGSQPEVGLPEDRLTRGEIAAPPVVHAPPAEAASSSRRRVPRWAAGVMGVAAGIGVTMAMLGPAQSVGTRLASEPVAAVTVKQDAPRANLRTEVQRAQFGVALEQARIGVDLSASGNFGASADYVSLQRDSFRHEANGFTFTYSGARLIAQGGTEDVPVYDAREGQMPEYLQAFADEGAENWHVRTTVRPAGGAATLASIAVTSDVYTGGSPNQSAELMTFDHVEGKRVLLDELLSPRQHAHVLNTVRAQLQAVPAGSLFQHDNLGEIVNRSFAVVDEGGKELKLVVAVPGNHEANEGKVAQLTFGVPRDILK